MVRRVSARRVKTHNQYTYQQAADVLGVSVQTVRLWRGSGLPVLDSQKPHLILGFALKDFLNKRSNKPERRLAGDQFLCMTCDAPTRAYGGMADYRPLRQPVAGLRRCAKSAAGYAASLPAHPFAMNLPQSCT